MRPQSEDERIFFRATGLNLEKLVARHIGKDSQDQIFEWISIVLGGREFFEAAPGTYMIHTLKGWYQYLEFTGYHKWRDDPTGAEEGKTSDAQPPTHPT